MRARTWFAAILVVIGGAFTAFRVSGSTPAVEEPPDEAMPPMPPPRLNTVAWERPRPIPVQTPDTTRLSIRVLAPDGTPYRDLKDTPSVILLHGGSRRHLDVSTDNTVTTDLTPGAYEVEAYTTTLAGTTGALELLPGDDLHADLRLSAGTHLRGTITFPKVGDGNDEEDGDQGEDRKGDSWSVRFVLADASEDDAPTTGWNGNGATFDVFPLLPGKRYDVVFSHPGARDATLRGVTAPTDGLTVAFESLPTLRGAYGVPKGDPCPISTVEVFDPDGAFHLSAIMNEWCRFHLSDLPDCRRVRIQIKGRPDLDRDVDIPANGDPPFVCLGGACSEPRPEDKATLYVSLDAPELPFQIIANYASQPDNGFVAKGTDVIELDSLESGVAMRVTLAVPACARTESTVQLGPGINRVALHCDPRKRVYVHVPASIRALGSVEIRCASETHTQEATALQVGSTRTLECPREDQQVGYRFSVDEAWRFLPLGELDSDHFIAGVRLPVPTDG